VAGAPHHAEVLRPRAHGFLVLVRHHPRYLVNVSQIVSGPRRQQLRQRDDSERWMSPAQRKPVGFQVERSEPLQILGSQSREFIQQVRERLALAVTILRRPIEAIERPGFTELQNDLGALNPVRPFPMNQMANDVEDGPGIGSFISRRPEVRQVTQKHIQGAWCARE
jgi:hypothetical protein